MRSSTIYGTARYRTTVASIAIHTCAISERAYVYSGIDASCLPQRVLLCTSSTVAVQ